MSRAPREYRLDNGAGLALTVLDLGGIVSALEAPDRAGRRANVVLALPTAADYLGWGCGMAFMVGRFVGTGLMRVVAPARLLWMYALACTVLEHWGVRRCS